MNILADENIPFAREAFGTLGDVQLAHGRSITAAQMAEVDLLFVRSITRVNAALLEGAAVRFVGTATAGVDHLYAPWLEANGVAFASAAGCNANSVAEYMTAAWLTLAARQGRRLEGLRVGIVGVGHVGSQVDRKARALGMTPVWNDPPLARQTGDERYRPLDELMDCDILTFHTPLTRDGQDATVHLADAALFDKLKPGCLFCNASRGEVVDESALHRAMDAGRLSGVVLDVWENEPAIDGRLLERVDLASPHIAGYSYDGKVNGTILVYEAACRFLNRPPTWRAGDHMAAPEFPTAVLDGTDKSEEAALLDLVTRLYPIERDDQALRGALALDADRRGPYFDRLRKEYPYRREFQNTCLQPVNASPRLLEKATGLGFLLPA